MIYHCLLNVIIQNVFLVELLAVVSENLIYKCNDISPPRTAPWIALLP